MRAALIVEVDEHGQCGQSLGVRAVWSGVRPLAEQGPDEALRPYIVLSRGSGTDGAVAGERDAMVALRYAVDQSVAWPWQGVPAIAGHGAARLERAG